MMKKMVIVMIVLLISSLCGCSIVENGGDEKYKEILENKIDEQSFEVNLNDWGKVTFISCMPDAETKKNPLTDVAFYLANDEKIIYSFPGVAEDNIRMSGLCEGVSFVYFDDTNRDNADDVIIGVQYISGAGPQGMIPYTEVRIYESCDMQFIYNEGLCEKINKNLMPDVTEEEVKKIISASTRGDENSREGGG